MQLLLAHAADLVDLPDPSAAWAHYSALAVSRSCDDFVALWLALFVFAAGGLLEAPLP